MCESTEYTMRKRATVATVAAAAGVSRQTVSNVLNQPERVQPGTRERVLQAIAELDYRPSFAARQLKTGRSYTIGYGQRRTAGAGADPIGDDFMYALASAAQQHNYHVLLFASTGDADELSQYHKLRTQADVDGFVLTHTHHDDERISWLTQTSTPFVTFGRPWSEDSSPHPWVDIDGAAGTSMAVAHLWSLGYRRIGFLGWPEGSDVGDDRRRGWRNALVEKGQTLQDLSQRWIPSLNDAEAAAAAAADLLPHVDAVVSVSDVVAYGALREIERLGVRVPVVGFDDSPIAAVTGLSTISQPLEVVAEQVLHRLIDPALPSTLIPPQLIERSSTFPVPAQRLDRT